MPLHPSLVRIYGLVDNKLSSLPQPVYLVTEYVPQSIDLDTLLSGMWSSSSTNNGNSMTTKLQASALTLQDKIKILIGLSVGIWHLHTSHVGCPDLHLENVL